MVEYDRTQEREHAQVASHLKICVAGIGGAGLNVLDRITLDRIVDATLVSMHSDVRVLSHAMTPHKIQLGAEIMRGIGSGGDPELGRESAVASREQIRNVFQGHDMVFLCAGLGGGTGSGTTPVVAQIAKECGAMVFVFATMPFSFEGRRRLMQAEMALEEIQPYADALILFENNRMGELILPKEGIQKAFSQSDQLIGHSVRAISTMVTQPGIVRLGLSDLTTALRSPNARCLFGFGEARGSSRVTDALKRALKSPLVNQGQLLLHAENLLVHVAGGESLTLAEVETLMKQLGKHVPEQTQILFGISVDPKLGDSLALTLISSLSAQQMLTESAATMAEESSAPPQRPKPVAQPLASAPAPVTAPAPKAKTQDFELSLNTSEPAVPIEKPQPVAAKPEPVSEPPVITHSEPAAEITPPPQKMPESSTGHAEHKVMSSILKAEIPESKPHAPHHTDPPAEAKNPQARENDPPSLTKHSIFEMLDEEETEGDDTDESPAAVAPMDNGPPAKQNPVASSTAKLEPALASAGKSDTSLQATLKLHQDEVARFKGTDKTIVEGEDLDVPTWMRLKQKLRR